MKAESTKLSMAMKSSPVGKRQNAFRITPTCIAKLSASERGVDAASLSLLPQLSLNSNRVGSFPLKRPDRRRAEAALFRLRLRLRRDHVVAKRRRRRAAKAEGRAPRNRQLRVAPVSPRPATERMLLSALALAITALLSFANAAERQILLRTESANALIQVQGDVDDEWRIETSSDLVTWTNLTSFGTLLSGQTNAPSRSVGGLADLQRFYRALKTAGLYDPTLFRTISLTFTQSNWGTLLASGRKTGSNVLCILSMDNGATNYGVGARYKGNTSFILSGTKKSINIELDTTNTATALMGFETINLNNAAGDETIMREPLYFNVMSKYTPCPRGSMARVHINGALWGVYSLIQQENGQLIKEWFPSNDGDRWRAPNAADGGGAGFTSSNSAFAYFNTTNIFSYRSRYELKTTNS